jgi:hypothetical protein
MAGKTVATNSEITALPDALQLPTRELIELLVEPLRAGLDLYEAQAKEQHRDALVARPIRSARRLLAQLENALPEPGE